MQTEYFKAVVLILLPSRNPLTTAQRAQLRHSPLRFPALDWRPHNRYHNRSIDTAQSTEGLKSRLSFSTEANGGGTVIPGSTAPNLTLSANRVEITLNDAASSTTTKTFTSTIPIQHLLNAGRSPMEYFKQAVVALILLPSQKSFNYIAKEPAPTFSAADFQPLTGVFPHSTRQPAPSIPPSRPRVSKLGSHSQQKPMAVGLSSQAQLQSNL